MNRAARSGPRYRLRVNAHSHPENAFEIAGRRIGADAPPYIIAELSANHGGDLARARRIVEIAAAAGADAIKLQAYTADSLTLDCDAPDFTIQADTPWKGRRLHGLYAEAATPYAWFPELFALARRLGLAPFASPFDAEAVALLERLDAPAYKIASFEAQDLELLRACGRTGKPVVVSTGLCTAEEIGLAVETLRATGNRQIALLRCNSSYPADPTEAHLATLPDMAARFGVPIGYSDHTLDNTQAVVAVALGACLVEKHVIDAREPPTPDSTFSCLPGDLSALVRDCRAAWQARGGLHYGPTPREVKSLSFRRSLYVVAEVKAGEPLTRDNVRCIRPGHGLPPPALPEVLGRLAARDLRRGEPLKWDMLVW